MAFTIIKKPFFLIPDIKPLGEKGLKKKLL
jgi:hypothetical protein